MRALRLPTPVPGYPSDRQPTRKEVATMSDQTLEQPTDMAHAPEEAHRHHDGSVQQEQQMCCDGSGRTAEQHRAESEDGKCCVDK